MDWIKKSFYICFLLCMISSDGRLANSDPLPTAIQSLDQSIQKQIKDKKVIGCAVAVVDHGKIIFIKAYGVRKTGSKEPINLNTLFQLGSISKTLSATLVGILIKENRFKLESPAAHFYPKLSPETTVQHILSHTTGFERKGWNQKIEASQTRDQMLNELAASQQATGTFRR